MKNSGVLGVTVPKNLASGYTHNDLSWEKKLAGTPVTERQLKKMPVLKLTSPAGDAFMFSTLDDLYRWSQIMEGNTKLAAPAEAAEIYKLTKFNYGYGWLTGDGFDRKRARHNGQLPGYLTDFIRFPDEKITLIIFSNTDRALLGRIARDVSAILLGTPYDMPVRGKVIKLDTEQIAKLEGKYKMADGKILTIRNEPDFLTAKLQDRYTAGLIPLSPTEFYFPLGDGRAIFTLNDKGTAIKVNMRYSGEDHIAERIIE